MPDYHVIYKKPKSGLTKPITVYNADGIMDASRRARNRAAIEGLLGKGYLEYGITKIEKIKKIEKKT